MPLDRAAIGQALRQWLLLTAGLPDSKVVFAFQPGDVPQWPYISLNSSLATASSGVYDEQVWSPDNLTRIERRTITASVNVYGAQGQALSLADAACDGLESLAVTELLDAAGLSIIDKGSPHNLSELEQCDSRLWLPAPPRPWARSTASSSAAAWLHRMLATCHCPRQLLPSQQPP